ncbi:MAG: YvcK family protein [Candidatus Promineofilum sp.]|nr:YvcK family protein [Promineifilum sp.]
MSDIWRAIYIRRRWLAFGIGIKRWLLVLIIGTAMMSAGWLPLLLAAPRDQWLLFPVLPLALRVLLPFIVGGTLVLLAVIKLGKNLVEPLRAGPGAVVDSLYDHRLRDRGPHIVAIGGGTGMPGLLRGLTSYTSNITAIVTVADDGGSSGRLRKELGLLPPGDFRNNLAALARDESLMIQVLQYRFGTPTSANGQEPPAESGLGGHAFGNLLLAALTGITGSFDEALLAAQRVLALRGQVLPSTLDNVTLVADVAVSDGEIVEVVGESAIPEARGRVETVRLDPQDVRAYPPAVRAIFQADLIVLGPGSLYTSILPNLLITDLAEALVHCRATVAYICNLATQPGETVDYSAADHVNAIRRHVPDQLIDVVVANDNFSVAPDTGGGDTQFVQIGAIKGVRLITTDLVDEARPWRHDSRKLARTVLNLLS